MPNWNNFNFRYSQPNHQYSIGGVHFWKFWIFNILQLNFDWQNNSKTKAEKAFFFILKSYELKQLYGSKYVYTVYCI
jgi:hypothetical protein